MKENKDSELIERLNKNFFEANKPENAREIKVEAADSTDDCGEAPCANCSDFKIKNIYTANKTAYDKLRALFGPYTVTSDIAKGKDWTVTATYKKDGDGKLTCVDTKTIAPDACPMYLSDMEFLFVPTVPNVNITEWVPNGDEIIYTNYYSEDGSRYVEFVIRPMSNKLYLDTFISDKIYYNAAIGLKWEHGSQDGNNFKRLGRGFRVISMDFYDAIESDELDKKRSRHSAENVIKEFKYKVKLEILD